MNRKPIRRHRSIKKYTYLGCPMTKNRSPWCFRMCEPNIEGKGCCGRHAPHAIKSKYQIAITNYEKSKDRNFLKARAVKQVKRHRSLPSYTYLGCPMTKNRSPWCFRLCIPDENSLGKCGRVAPHTLKGIIQQGIIDYECCKKKAAEEKKST